MNGAERVYLNGELTARGEAAISPLDRGFLYGDGFFETTRIVTGVPLLLGRHLERLASSCSEAGISGTPSPDELSLGIGRLIEANGVAEGYLRITVSRGLHGGSLTELCTGAPTVFAEARSMNLPPLDGVPPITLARSTCRRNEHSPVVGHKSLSYQSNVLALAEGRRAGADEVFFLNSQGRLAEGAVTNLFLVREGVVCTPDVSCGLLPGVTRGVVLELCEELHVPAETGTYTEAQLYAADEVFCTNSLRGVIPVARILDCPEFGPASHDFTRRLQAEYASLVRRLGGPGGGQ